MVGEISKERPRKCYSQNRKYPCRFFVGSVWPVYDREEKKWRGKKMYVLHEKEFVWKTLAKITNT